jgi:8-oxo-dGTP diphosphatase
MNNKIYKAEPFIPWSREDPRWVIINPDNNIIAVTASNNDELNATRIVNALNNLETKCKPVQVGCTIMIVRDKKVLLGKREKDCETTIGEYAFPGGRMEFGENPSQTIIRELFEETGLIIIQEDLIFLRYVNEYFPQVGKHYVSLVFMGTHPVGEPMAKEKTKCKEWEWFDPDNIPKNTFAPTAEIIKLNKDRIEQE